MVSINPYLTFPGTCEEAFLFYKSVFGGEFPYMGKFKDMPPMDGKPVPENEKEKIMHVSLPIGGSILMGSDSSEAFGHATVIKRTVRQNLILCGMLIFIPVLIWQMHGLL